MDVTEAVVTLEVTLTEVNLILASLSELPFKISAGLIVKLKDQATAQLNPKTGPALVPDTTAENT